MFRFTSYFQLSHSLQLIRTITLFNHHRVVPVRPLNVIIKMRFRNGYLSLMAQTIGQTYCYLCWHVVPVLY